MEEKDQNERPVQSEQTDVTVSAGTAEEPKNSRKMLVFGGIVLIFAVIGVIATVLFLSRTAVQLAGNNREKDTYEWLITPVVLQDPPTFESPDKLIDSTIITAGVWRLIMNEDTSKYPADQMNFISVPQSDIEVQIKALFGDVKYTHQSVGDTELLITYDEENKAYVFPAVPHVLAYTPEVQEIQKADDKIVLTVGYIPPGPVWEGDVSGNKYRPSAEKIMTYTLQETEKGALKIYSVTGTAGEGSDFHPNNSGLDLGDMGSFADENEPAVPEGESAPEEVQESSLPAADDSAVSESAGG